MYHKLNITDRGILKYMKPFQVFLVLLVFAVFTSACKQPNPISNIAKNDLRIILIRHGEKPDKGDNLSCQGFNRSLQLPKILYSRFGIPNDIYVPAPGLGKATKNSRMLETIIPFAVKYNLQINTSFDVDAVSPLAQELKTKTGTILIVWEHKELPDIAKNLGINSELKWKSDDFDTIWIIDIRNGTASISADQENISTPDNCSF